MVLVVVMMMMIYRWAPDHDMDKQPDYLKFVLDSTLNILEELEREVRKTEGSSYSFDATKDEVTFSISHIQNGDVRNP